MLTPQLLQSFFVQQDAAYQEAYQAFKPYWQNYGMTVPSSTKVTIHHWLAQLPAMREWVGEKVVNRIAAHAYQIINKDFENTYEVDRNDLNDDMYGIYANHPKLQAEVAARWPEDLLTKALINGINTTCYDAQYFFDTDHPVDIDDPTLGTYSNLLASTPLTATSYAQAKAMMRGYKGEGNVPLQVQPTLLMVGPALEQVGKEIINATNIVQPVKNVGGTEIVAAVAKTNVYVGDAILVVNERLVDDEDGAWYLMSTDRIKPLAFQQREAPHRVGLVDPQSPSVFYNKKFLFSIEARGNAGYTLPFLAIKGRNGA